MVRIRVDDVAQGTRTYPPPMPAEIKARQLMSTAESFSHADRDFLPGPDGNPLLMAFRVAFSQHLPLELSPDVIFNTVLQGVAALVALDPERHRSSFVAHEGTARLHIRDDTLVKGRWEGNNWKGVVDQLSALVDQHLVAPETRRALATRFTTTDPASALAHKAVFLDTVKHYFQYHCSTMCGIPWIDLAGTREDWQSVRDTLLPLMDTLDFPEWRADVDTILSHCVRAFTPEGADRAHWQRAYKHRGVAGSGGSDYVTGWISRLFPRLSMGANPAIGAREEREIDEHYFPKGLTHTPFVWHYYDQTHDMRLSAGLVGVCDTPAGALKPEVGWIIGEALPPGTHEPRSDMLRLFGHFGPLGNLRQGQANLIYGGDRAFA